MKIIISTNGYEIQVSDEDYEFLQQWNWCVTTTPTSLLVRKSTNTSDLPIACLILQRRGISFKGLIDHKDRNSLNNQFENLRPATYSQNNANKGLQRNNTSGYKGVSYHKRSGKFRVMIAVQKHATYLGTFLNPEEAAKAYDRAAKRLFGEFAVLNFPEKL